MYPKARRPAKKSPGNNHIRMNNLEIHSRTFFKMTEGFQHVCTFQKHMFENLWLDVLLAVFPDLVSPLRRAREKIIPLSTRVLQIRDIIKDLY